MTVCARCEQPIADGEGSVQYPEVVGLQEWTVWTYHAICAPQGDAANTRGSLGFDLDRHRGASAPGQQPRPDETGG